MRKFFAFFFAMILVLSFCFVLSGLTQEKKETEGVYTIKKGDTLWDISAKFLKDPFLWPKLWERNPYITNPHWIYPGNPIQLTASRQRKRQPRRNPRRWSRRSPKRVKEKPKEAVKKARSQEARARPSRKEARNSCGTKACSAGDETPPIGRRSC